MNAVDLYHEVVRRVPAYRSFLIGKVGCVPEVSTLTEFEERVPMMDKSDYIMQHEVADLCLDRSPPCAHLWLRSSGTSKKPFFWPRRAEDEKGFPQGMRKLFHAYVSPDVQPTLIIVGLALGPWGTGMQSSFAFRTIAAEENSGLAVCSPGLQNDSIIEVLERISPMYKQTVLLSYPPFAKMVLEEARDRGLDLKALNIRLMVGGEGITETYRESMWDLLGYSEQDLDKVWSLYGSTDFANVGFENPLTIAARRILVKNDLCEDILGEPDIPMLFQRVPNPTHFEEVDGELVVSRMQGIPLIRYRSGDHVRFIEREELLQRIKNAGHDTVEMVRKAGLPVPDCNTPFVALYGRIDQAVFFYGAKINVEQVKMALEAPVLAPYYNGRFLMRGVESDAGYPMLEVALEASDAWENADKEQIAKQFSHQLGKVQSEFREVCKLHPDKTHVRLVVSPSDAFELGWKTRHM